MNYTTEPDKSNVQVVGDDEVVGTVEASQELKTDEERELYRKSKRYLCTHCRKGIHNDKMNLNKCMGKVCECLCQWYYEGLDGKLRQHGTPDDSFSKVEKVKPRKSSRTVEEINAEWNRNKR